MKKIFLVVFMIVFLIGGRGASASTYSIKYNDNTFDIETKYIGNKLGFIISPFDDYKINSNQYLNNLAYIMNDDYYFDEFKYAIIQLMIFENTNSDIEYKLFINDSNIYIADNIINNYKKNINAEIDALEKELSLTSYEFDYKRGDVIEIIEDGYFHNMEISVDYTYNFPFYFDAGINADHIRIYALEGEGKYKIDIKSKIFLSDNILYGNYYSNDDFSIYVNILSNKFKLNIIYPDDNINEISFEIYDTLGNLYGSIITRADVLYTYDIGYDLVLKRVSNDTYEDNEDIIIYENANHYTEIDYVLKYPGSDETNQDNTEKLVEIEEIIPEPIKEDNIEVIDLPVGDIIIEIPNTGIDVYEITCYMRKYYINTKYIYI